MSTFLVRLWRQSGDPPDTVLRGVVECAGEHATHPFRDELELLALLRELSVSGRGDRESARTGAASSG
ncbi:MAG TPA: hypothetical protein VMN35_00060 [Gaiellaceae bacterium]|nr:hypothetical protein [Gaiellaceae bacterium]